MKDYPFCSHGEVFRAGVVLHWDAKFTKKKLFGEQKGQSHKTGWSHNRGLLSQGLLYISFALKNVNAERPAKMMIQGKG